MVHSIAIDWITTQLKRKGLRFEIAEGSQYQASVLDLAGTVLGSACHIDRDVSIVMALVDSLRSETTPADAAHLFGTDTARAAFERKPIEKRTDPRAWSFVPCVADWDAYEDWRARNGFDVGMTPAETLVLRVEFTRGYHDEMKRLVLG